MSSQSLGLFTLLRSDVRAAVQIEQATSLKFWKKYAKYALLNRAYGGLVYYRFGYYAFTCRVPLWSILCKVFYLLNYQLVQCWTGIEISYKAEIGPYCLLLHSGQIIGDALIGSHFTGRAGILIGQVDGCYPIIGNNVMLGAHAIVVGGVLLGDNVKVGAGTTVVKNVDDNQTVVSARARVLESR